MVIILHRSMLVTLRVLYFVPGTTILAPEFTWQTDDKVPDIPRVHRFLNYWHENIDAVISNVEIMYGLERGWRRVDYDRRA